jgi:hypothetical protein
MENTQKVRFYFSNGSMEKVIRWIDVSQNSIFRRLCDNIFLTVSVCPEFSTAVNLDFEDFCGRLHRALRLRMKRDMGNYSLQKALLGLEGASTPQDAVAALHCVK